MNIVDEFIEYLKKNKNIEAYTFFQEVPVKVKAEVLDIDEIRKQIELKVNEKFVFAVADEKEVYFNFKNEVLVSSAVYWDKDIVVIFFPKIALEPKTKRKTVRVKVSSKNPIKMKLFFDENDSVCIFLNDISEDGIGFMVSHDIEQKLHIGKKYKAKLFLNGEYDISIEIRYLYKLKDDIYKVGAKIVEAPRNLPDKIAKYVAERQKEIIKLINEIKG